MAATLSACLRNLFGIGYLSVILTAGVWEHSAALIAMASANHGTDLASCGAPLDDKKGEGLGHLVASAAFRHRYAAGISNMNTKFSAPSVRIVVSAKSSCEHHLSTWYPLIVALIEQVLATSPLLPGACQNDSVHFFRAVLTSPMLFWCPVVEFIQIKRPKR